MEMTQAILAAPAAAARLFVRVELDWRELTRFHRVSCRVLSPTAWVRSTHPVVQDWAPKSQWRGRGSPTCGVVWCGVVPLI